MRFLYDSVNKPLPTGDFAVPELKGLSPVPPEPLDADYNNRFINLSDGSDGNMNVKYARASIHCLKNTLQKRQPTGVKPPSVRRLFRD
jgi:hypothetical protein